MNRLAWWLALALAATGSAQAKDPDCTGPNRWPARIAEGRLERKGLLDPKATDFAKTTVIKISSEKVGPDTYRQIHIVRFVGKDGRLTQVMTINDANSEECSASEVEVFPVIQKIGTGFDGFGNQFPPE